MEFIRLKALHHLVGHKLFLRCLSPWVRLGDQGLLVSLLSLPREYRLQSLALAGESSICHNTLKHCTTGVLQLRKEGNKVVFMEKSVSHVGWGLL